MKRLFFLAILCCIASCGRGYLQTAEKTISIDRDWCFNYFPDGDSSFVAPSLDGFLNGQCICEHKGGYNSFCIDITPFVRPENLLAVQVSARRDDEIGTIPPATAGNFNVYGGIYRSARIVVKKAHVDSPLFSFGQADGTMSAQ